MDRPQGPPDPVRLARAKSKRSAVAYRLLQVLSGRLMADSVTAEVKKEAGHYARLFLQAFHLWDLEQRMETEGQDALLDDDDNSDDMGVPSWVRASNFASLLNLVERVMDKYGSLRKLWEGGPLGEGVVKEVREFAQSGMRSGFAVSAHSRASRRMQGANLPSRFSTGSDGEYTYSRKMYHKYKEDRIAVQHRIATSVPISGVVLGMDGDRVKFGVMRTHKEVVVLCATVKICCKYGLDFFALSATGEQAIDASTLNEYCIFLPWIEDGERCYCSITSEWRELSQTGNGSQVLERGSGVTMAMF